MKSNSSSSPAYPSKSSQIRLNPSAVPVEKGFGIETIVFQSGFDFALVKGLGRVGAAVSPSNGEETFFGAPGPELDSDKLARMTEKKKYKSQKVALAGAFSIYGNKKDGLKRFQLNLGLIGKYNRYSKGFSPGGGLSMIVGPLTFGYAVSQDEYYVDDTVPALKYRTNAVSAGIFLSSAAVDYSLMKVYYEGMPEPTTVTLLTGSLLLKKWILTLAGRQEDSPRNSYDFKTKTMIYEKFKHETFGGVQYALTPRFMIGLYHNYYLLREFSAGATLFF